MAPLGFPKADQLVLSVSPPPPVPGKAVKKIRRDVFLDFKELLPDNIALLQRLQEVGRFGQGSALPQARLREIRNPLLWASCFLSFLAVKTEDLVARVLAAYGMIVLQLAMKHGGCGWMSYDTAFRQQKAAGAAIPSW